MSPSSQKKNISFIGKPVFFRPGVSGGEYPVRLSSRIRGQEIAEYLGANYYYDNGNFDKNDICIYLKPGSLDTVRDGDYVDVLDGIKLLPLLQQRPKIKVIAMSKAAFDYLKSQLENEVVYIPHHHINLENHRRIRNEHTANKPLVGGMIGKAGPQSYEIFEPIQKALAKVGIELRECFTYQNRQDILDFHQQIDFQVIWYWDMPADINSFYRHPTKIANAASFGIPTITQKILGHLEFEGDYIEVENYDDIVKAAVKLQDLKYYNQLSERLINRAAAFHISQIALLYQQLK